MRDSELADILPLSQLLSDFKTDAPYTPTLKKAPASKARAPIKIKGVDHNSFAQWIRSAETLRKVLQEKFGSPKITLENCIWLYTEYNIKIDDFVVLWFPTADVMSFREYDRDIEDGWTGKMSQEEYTDLMQDIQRNGIKNPGILEISNHHGGMYDVKLGEGNHRLRIAGELGLDKFPLSFSYKYG